MIYMYMSETLLVLMMSLSAGLSLIQMTYESIIAVIVEH